MTERPAEEPTPPPKQAERFVWKPGDLIITPPARPATDEDPQPPRPYWEQP